MTEDDVALEAKVTRYNIVRLRSGQLLVPIAVLTAVAARRFPGVLTVLLAVGVQAATLALLLSAGRRFGWQSLVPKHGGLLIGSTGERVERHKVHRWTAVNGVARLYGVEQSYKLRARSGAESELAASLARCFGPPLNLRRRGSFRARMVALAVGLCGLVGVAVGIVVGINWLAVAGPLAFIIGVATFGALSQRTA